MELAVKIAVIKHCFSARKYKNVEFAWVESIYVLNHDLLLC